MSYRVNNQQVHQVFFVSIFFCFRMTKNDVKQYLEKIYKIDVLDITTIIKQGFHEVNL
jgi:ribosomal protein L23